MFFKKEKLIPNTISIYLIYKYGNYDSTKLKKYTIEKLIDIFKIGNWHNNGIVIESKFNNIIYPVFDLDDKKKLELFYKIYNEVPYIIFQTSNNHYWAILDEANDINNIFNNTKWLTCNDTKYIKYCKKTKKITIRGLYKTFITKPTIIKRHSTFSDNFDKFINKLSNFYDEEGLELSVLYHKTTELILKYGKNLKYVRKKKLEKLKEIENEN